MKLISNAMHTSVVETRWVGMTELRQLRAMLNRAMNTLEPVHTPAWLSKLSEDCDKALGMIDSKAKTPNPKPFATVRVDHLGAAVTALRYKAHSEAGHSQGEDAFDKEDTADWASANAIEEAVKEAIGELQPQAAVR